MKERDNSGGEGAIHQRHTIHLQLDCTTPAYHWGLERILGVNDLALYIATEGLHN
jgi:hypothetical protein